ncbi:hypothetical protein SGLAM104S_03166 [Streptomyces glaucescens]
MPTASPSISARLSAVEDTVTAEETASSPTSPVPIPTNAVSSGIPAASSEPKVRASTASATTTPSSSRTLGVRTPLPYACPPTDTVRPASSAVLAVSSSASRVPSSRSERVTS